MDGKVVIKISDPKYSIPVEIKGKKYLSMSQAAKELNVSRETVNYRCKNRRFPKWKFIEETKISDCFTPEFSSMPIKLEVDGIEFGSLSAAARKFKVDINIVKSRCRSLSYPTWICDKFEKQGPKDGRPGLIQIEIDGIKYRSVNEASKVLKITRPTIKKRLNSEEWENYKILNSEH